MRQMIYIFFILKDEQQPLIKKLLFKCAHLTLFTCTHSNGTEINNNIKRTGINCIFT